MAHFCATGVVGGVVVLALLALLLWLIFFRGKKQRAPSAMPLVDQKSDGGYMAETESSLPAGYGVGYPSPTSMGTAQRLYEYVALFYRREAEAAG